MNAMYAVDCGYLVEVVNEHTCGAGDFGQHEPGCGTVPVAPIEELLRADARLAAVEAALDDRVTPTLGNAHWAVDPLPPCPNYSHVNPDWLLALITEARATRAALHSDPSERA